MAIVSSVTISADRQIDDRLSVTENHTDHLGVVTVLQYMANQGTNLTTSLAANAVIVWNNLKSKEINSNYIDIIQNGSSATPSINYSTVSENAAFLRANFVNATRRDAIMIGDYLSARTDAQLQAAFSITAAQVTALRTRRLTPAATAAATIRAFVGE